MLKEYFDRNSLPVAINVGINVPSNKSVEEDFEDDNKEPNFFSKVGEFANTEKCRPKTVTFVYNKKRTTKKTDK